MDDFLTQADVNSQKLIVAGLLNKWPSLRIIGAPSIDSIYLIMYVFVIGEEDLKQVPGSETPDTCMMMDLSFSC